MFKPVIEQLRGPMGFSIAAVLLCLVTVSAVWIENDAYRYSCGVLIIAALVDYWRMPQASRPSIGWGGVACVVWALYVGLRYAWVFFNVPGKHGSAEGIYLFPLIFPTIGYAFFLLRNRLTGLADLFMLISLVMLGITIDLSQVFDGERTPFLFQNNTIHASVSAGLITICALAYAENTYRNRANQNSLEQALRLMLALAVIALCLLGIYGAKSKGVWLALALSVPIQALTSLVHLPRKQVLVGASMTVLGVAIILFIGSAGIIRELAPVTASGLALFDATLLDGVGAVRTAIAQGSVPFSFNERLMLWMNALEIITAHPIFGAGIGWQRIWVTTTYASVPYNLMHNGYVEIAIRYGLSGLVFFAALYTTFAWWVLRAWQKRLLGSIEVKVWLFGILFFALTLLTNSNNRLAIGESFILITAGFAFYAYYLTQPRIDK
ncbi:O-antigen ligase family protein [Tianweitania sp. BSSL-BM11]|uniref:O-antigen ligase family protein n=1 Tax=Tianweitania aestuarii TaxID=2814886 RepID=A0ABS5RYI1_9HYPH|nr:O-antigen ligase family protein [Tianweitania aestuarii]MBS9721289.1 O-antigen ligase family protein [Tianweitania aestuarii]